MSKLSKKLIRMIILVIIGVGICLLLMNSIFVEKYYLRSKKIVLENVYEKIVDLDKQTIIDNIEHLEREYELNIRYIGLTGDVDVFNDRLRQALAYKGISVNKLWVTPEHLKSIEKHGDVNILANQGNLNYSLLMKLADIDDTLFVFVMTIPHVTETINIINQFISLLLIGAVGITVTLIIIFSKKIIGPLVELSLLAQDIAKLQFRQADIHTGDEIEDLANSINIMSKKLELSHKALDENNQQLKQLIGDVSHELKTPIALIKAYGEGIKDEMDDGSFLDIIIEQNEEMEKLVDKLLSLARLYKENLNIESFNLSELLQKSVERTKVLGLGQDITFSIEIEENVYVLGDENSLQSVISNLLTNAVKYTEDKKIHIQLQEIKDKVYLRIKNGILEDKIANLTGIWEPFYVGESSRNKHLSGTGLGLAIVKVILDKHDMKYGYHVLAGEIEFYIELANSKEL